MQYDRFLDIHFVTSKPTNLRRYANDPEKLNEKIAAQKIGNYAQGQYQYDFQKDQTGQQTYYIRKLQPTLHAFVSWCALLLACAFPIFCFLRSNLLPLHRAKKEEFSKATDNRNYNPTRSSLPRSLSNVPCLQNQDLALRYHHHISWPCRRHLLSSQCKTTLTYTLSQFSSISTQGGLTTHEASSSSSTTSTSTSRSLCSA